MADDIQTELAALRLAVERLTQGLQLMLETQATHTEMLRQLQEAAAAEPEPSPVADALGSSPPHCAGTARCWRASRSS